MTSARKRNETDFEVFTGSVVCAHTNQARTAMSLRIVTLATLALVTCGLGAGCATQPPIPTEQITKARALVEQADKTDAQRYAAADLQRAHDELSNAEKAVTDRKYAD